MPCPLWGGALFFRGCVIMLCARTRADGSHGCRTRASAGGGRGVAGTGGHHGYYSTNTQVIGSHHIHFLRKGLSSLALVFLLLLVPRYAYAAPSLEVDGNFAGYEDGEEYKGYVVVDSPDNYQSTLCLIGEWAKLPQITTEQYETLSNPSTGGAFYELSQLWKKLGLNASGTEEYYPQWLALSEDFADGLVTVYGYGKVWAAVCTDDLIEQAKEDLNTILDGGSVGGGSSSEPDTDGTYVFIDTVPNDQDMPEGKEVTTAGLAIPQDKYNKLLGFASNNTEFQLWITIGPWAGSAGSTAQNCYTLALLDKEPVYFFTDLGTWGCWHWPGAFRSYGYSHATSARGFVTHNEKKYLIADQSYNFSIITRTSNNDTDGIRPTFSYYWGDIHGSGSGSGGGSVEPSPDPWEPPTNPETPTNPTTPTPKDPITPDPPTLPGAPTDPTQPAPPQSPTVGDGGTYTVDLQGILDALDEHCIHIQTCLNSNFSGQNSYLGELFSTYTAAIVDQIYNGDVSKIGAIGDLQNTVTQGFNDILSYWDDYVEWLDKKLDFKWPETDTYDDADLLNWLRKIWARQGTGDVNTRPVDPATNYGGMSKWLGVLYGEIAGDVSDTSLTALSSSLNALQHTFPFSLPWDIQQILQSLDATPATPAASITVPALAGAWDAYSYDIDLHWMDSSMVAVRGFELLAFVLYCLVHTKEVFGYVVGD